jgi:hypothetical protein
MISSSITTLPSEKLKNSFTFLLTLVYVLAPVGIYDIVQELNINHCVCMYLV